MKLGKPDLLKIIDGDYVAVNNAYIEIIEKGKNAVQLENISEDASLNAFCSYLIPRYISWQDYIHANNLMQTFKRTVEKGSKQAWFNRMSITIYGKRTPLYFIENPEILVDKIKASIGRNLEKDTVELTGTINELFNFLFNQFASDNECEFTKQVKNIFIPYFTKNMKNLDLLPDVKLSIENFIKSLESPQNFTSPGINNVNEDEEDEFPIWDEVSLENSPELVVENVNSISEEPNDLNYIRNKTIVFLGDAGSSIKSFISAISKKYGFKYELHDYDELTNMDIKKFKHSKVSAMIIGAVPHSVKNKGDNSSILETLKEPGYPKSFSCRANSQSNQLKFSKTVIKNTLTLINEYLKSLNL